MFKNYYIILLSFFIVACGSTESGKKLTVALGVEPISLTPFESNDIPSYKVRWQIYDRLISVSPEGEVIPELAETWTNINPTTLQITIKTNVVFHNGKPFTVEDAVYSVNTAVNSSFLSTVLGVIDNATVVNDNTFQVNLSKPYAPALALLSHSGMLMTSEEFNTEELKSLEIGTGPFQFVEWNRGQNIVLKKNDSYWGEVAEVDTVNFIIVPDASVRSIIVETGEADVAYDLDGSDRERLLASKDVIYKEASFPTVHYLGFNTSKGPLTNQTLRQAIAMAIDFQGIVDTIAFGAGETATSLLQESVFGAYTGLPKRERNIEKAKDLLVQAGIAPNTKIPLYAIEGPRKKMAEIIQANLREIGLDIEVSVLEWATMLDYARKGNLDMFILGWTSIPADADIGMYSLINSNTHGAGGNYTFYNNPKIDQLLEQGRAVQDTEKRKLIYQEIQEILYTELPMIPTYHPYHNVVMSKDIKYFDMNLYSIHRLNKIKY